jgi:DNA polymerase-3 subunit delta'
MSFRRVRGQERAVTALRSSLATGRLAHGYLITGPAGTGKRTLATELCRAALCEAGSDDACDRCRSCRAIESGNSWEFSIIRVAAAGGRTRSTPDPSSPGSRSGETSGEEREEMRPVTDADREIGIGSVRALERELALRCDRGRRRCALIPGADRLNEEAQNALLKTLEEPPGSRLLVLTACRPGALLPTVISRLARLRLRPLSADEVAACLIEDHGRTSGDARELAAASGGSVGTALTADIDEIRTAREFAARELVGSAPGRPAERAGRMAQWARESAGSAKGTEPLRRALLGAIGAALVQVRQSWTEELGAENCGPDTGTRQRRRIEALLRAERAIAAYVNPELVCRVLAGELQEG